MKKTLRLLICITIVVMALGFSALSVNAETEGVFTYEVSNGEATITKCEKTATGIMEIPSTLGEYPVVRIANKAFRWVEGITDIVIPEGVKIVESYGFYNCTSVKSIKLPESLESIGDAGFFGCWELTDVHIPKNVTYIGCNAFDNAVQLTAFSVDEENEYYASIDGVLYDKNITTLIRYPVKKSGGLYEVPSTVTRLRGYSIYDCDNLVSVIVPEGVIEIGNYAFHDCKYLTSVYFPKSLEIIGAEIFLGSAKVTDIYYGGLNLIGQV